MFEVTSILELVPTSIARSVPRVEVSQRATIAGQMAATQKSPPTEWLMFAARPGYDRLDACHRPKNSLRLLCCKDGRRADRLYLSPWLGQERDTPTLDESGRLQRPPPEANKRPNKCRTAPTSSTKGRAHSILYTTRCLRRVPLEVSSMAWLTSQASVSALFSKVHWPVRVW